MIGGQQSNKPSNTQVNTRERKLHMSQKESAISALRPIIESDGKFLEDITIVKAGKRLLVTVIIDSEQHLSLDDVAHVTRIISETLETLPELGDSPFTLEVTTPGVDRPLTLPRHWRKNIGRLVRVTQNNGETTSGRILEVDAESVTLDSGTLPLNSITRAVVEIEFKKLDK
jgi:ribosome maturation factor RimP